MDLSKYLRMLESNALWFSRIDCLGDNFEGSTPKLSVEAIANTLSANLPEIVAQNLQQINSDTHRRATLFSYANCWHQNRHESMAMWKLYGNPYGIAIISNLENISMSISSDYEIYPSLIKYIDYAKDQIESNNLFARLTHKRRSFEHEKEVRLFSINVLDQLPIELLTSPFDPVRAGLSVPVGVPISVDLNTLINEIRVDPEMPDWLYESVVDLTTKYGFHFKVRKSILGKDPIY